MKSFTQYTTALLLCMTPFFLHAQSSWTQLGADINGQSGDNGFGSHVSLSDNGKIMAVAAPSADATGSLKGVVRVYEYNGTWNQLGSDIVGESDGHALGSAIALDSSGSILAIGVPFHEAGQGAFSNSGQVKVYKWDGSTWNQLGSSLYADTIQENFGASIDISSDGTILAVGLPGSDGGGAARGRVKTYKWNTTSSDWDPLGSPLNGEGDYDVFGASVSLNDSGNYLAVGAILNAGGGLDAGHARVFKWNGSDWSQFGTDIDGDSASDNLGTALSLSADGMRLAVGAPQDFFMGGYGYVKIMEWSGSSWQALGSNISSPFDFDQFGYALDISKNGDYVIIGADANVPGNENGRAEVYKWSSSTWNLVGDTIKGASVDDYCGQGVAIADSGKVVAIGSPGNSTTAMGAGQIRAFEITNCSSLSVDLGNDTTVCEEITLDANNSGATYLWSNGETSQTILANTTGNYAVTITQSGCAAVDSIAITIIGNPVVELGNDTLACDSITLDAGISSAQYYWSTTDTTQTITVTTSNQYIVFVQQNGCITMDTIQVSIAATPQVNLGNDTTYCGLGTLTSASSGQFLWNTGDTTNNLLVNDSGIYSLTVSNMGCQAVDSISVNVIPLHTVDLGTDTLECDSMQLNAGNPGASYLWSNTDTTQSTSILSTGTYSVTVSKNGCDVVEDITITIHNTPIVDLGNDTTVCGKIDLDAGNPTAQHLWNTGLTDQVYTAELTGSYVVVVNHFGCNASDTINVIIKPIPAVNLGPNTVSCTTLTLDAGIDSVSYLWSNGDTSKTININSTGVYSISATKNGCTGIDSIQVNFNSTPTVDLGNDTTACTQIELNAGNLGASFLWNDGSTNQTLEINSSGTYYVQVTKNACVGSDTINITIVPAHAVNLGDESTECIKATLDAGNPSSGAEYLWSTGDTTQTIEINRPDTYSVSVTYNGCTVVDNVVKDIENWNQTSTLFNNEGNHRFVDKIDMPDSSTLAVGYYPLDIEVDSRKVIVYGKFNGNWAQKGNTLFGTHNVFDMADSNTIAMGSSEDNKVRVYIWSDIFSIWGLKGEVELDSGEIPVNVIMPDSNTLCVSYLDTAGTTHVQVYVWFSPNWVKRGNSFPFHNALSGLFRNVAMPDAHTLAIGQSGASDTGGAYLSGLVNVYSWDSASWVQKGQTIYGETSSGFGLAVAMPTPTTIGVGAPLENNSYGSVSIYSFDEENWVQKGPKLTGWWQERVGQQLYMPDETSFFTIRYRNLGNREISDYYWIDSTWVQRGAKYKHSINHGIHVAVPEPTTMAILEPFGFGTSSAYGGAVSIYNLCDMYPASINDPYYSINNKFIFKVFPNPTTGTFTIKGNQGIDQIRVYNYMGEMIRQINTTSNSQVELNVENESNGMYLIDIISGKNKETHRLILQQ